MDAPKSSKFKYRKEESPFLHFMTNLKRITGGVILQGVCLQCETEISIILLTLFLYYFKKKEENLQDDFYIAGWNGCIRGSIPLASHRLSNTNF